MKYLFLDTNYFLHFKAFDEVKWKEVLGIDDTTVVVVPTVIAELDMHKTNSNKRISKRAKSSLNKIEQYFETKKLKNGIGFQIVTDEPTEQIFVNNRLDKHVADDRIIASIIEFQDKYQTEVCLISHDTGSKIKARSKGIEVIKVPDNLALSVEKDPLEAENKRLASELQKFQNLVPELELLFENNEHKIKVTLDKIRSKSNKAIRLEEIKKRYPPMVYEAPSQNVIVGLQAALVNIIKVSKTSIEDYNQDLRKFYDQYEAYLEEKDEYDLIASRSIELDVKLINRGSAPASDIDIFMHFPDGFKLINADDADKPPTEPAPPRRPEPGFMGPSRISDHLPPTSTSGISYPTTFPNTNPSRPDIKKTNSYDVQVAVNSLKHHLTFSMNRFILTFDSYEAAKSFAIDYEISEANNPDMITGKLHVIVGK